MATHREQTKTDHEALGARVYSALISDALDALHASNQVMAPRIRPIQPLPRTLVGRAATARAVPVDDAPEEPYSVLLEAMDGLGAGDILIVAGEPRSAIFGGLLATAARARGGIGCVVDGSVRDARELMSMEFPTFATGFSPADSFGRDEVVEQGAPIECGGVTVQPGDLVVADHDGIAVVPAEVEERVLDHALAKLDRERDMRTDLAEGLPAGEAFAKYGIL